MSLARLSALVSELSDATLTSSNDVDAVVDLCTRALRDHALLVNERGSTLDTTMQSVGFGQSSISRLRYGADVTVVPAGPEETTFLFVIPLAGRGHLQYGSTEVIARRSGLFTIGPYDRFRFDFDGQYDQLVVKVPRSRVEAAAGQMVGAKGPVHARLPLLSGAVPAGLLEFVAGSLALRGSSTAGRLPRTGEGIESIVVESLLLPQLDVLDPDPSAPTMSSARLVRRAQDFMLADLSLPPTRTEIAMHCGVSVRTLQDAFRAELGASPMSWLRDYRLDRAHEALAAAHAPVSVSAIAESLGFGHLGDFAAQFRRRFGVTPSSVPRLR